MATTALIKTASVLTPRRFSIAIRRLASLWSADNIVISPYKDVEIPNMSISELVWSNLERWPDKTAVVCGVTDRQYTYYQLHKRSRNLAANLRRKLRICEGDVVCAMMLNCPEYPLSLLGVLQAGGILTTINPIYTAHEVERQLMLSDPKVLLGSPDTIPTLKKALELAKKNIPIISVTPDGSKIDDTISLMELIEDGTDVSVLSEVHRSADDVAVLPYSSGTTGLPKGVELTHRNIVVNCVQQDVEGVKQYNDTTKSHQDAVLAILPFYHIYGLSVVMLHKLSVGAKLVTLPKFQPTSFLNAMKSYKTSLLYAAPPIVLFLGSHPEVKSQHLDSLQKIMCGAAPLAKPDITNALNKTRPGTDLIQVYGLTETSPLVTATAPNSKLYTTAGFAIPNTKLKIVDAVMKHLGPNKVGELLIHGPQVMKGYKNNPEATKGCITEDGWFRSGDLAKLHEDGYVIIADRLKELIKVKGFQVPPAELEELLKEHPAVLDVGVIGIPDQRTGEAPKAFVVLKEGHKVSAEDIKDFAKERVAEYKKIKEVVFLDALPKNPSGKLLRRVLKDEYC